MTEDQKRNLCLATLKEAYARDNIGPGTIRTYAGFLKDIPADRLERATRSLIATSRFFPTIAEILEACRDGADELPNEGEAWGQVLQQVRSVGHLRTPEFSHPAVAGAVQSIGWLEICESENAEAVRAHFFRVYSALRGRYAADGVKRAVGVPIPERKLFAAKAPPVAAELPAPTVESMSMPHGEVSKLFGDLASSMRFPKENEGETK